MRVTFAMDPANRSIHKGNLPNCLKWAQERTGDTEKPIKIISCRAGERHGRVIAEVTGARMRLIESGALWDRKKLESLDVE